MERIYVAVRARPLSAEDAKTSPWRISGNSIVIPNQSSKFEFDRIFGEECKTRDVYEARTKDIVGAAVRGFNGTVFAYGQTNSGKTHTMRGTPSEPGVIPLAVCDLFDIIQEDMDREFLLRMSYMEIYNEEINDLLAPEHRKLQIHESIERGIFVAGLREEIVASPEQVLELMEFGESHRHIGETNMNVYSSRSHTIFRMIIESRERSEDDDTSSSCDAVRVSVLNLVDLAGSERAAKTGAEGVRLKEGSHINKSLMTLGTVIKKLSEGAESQGGHVPYRDSKLTRILQPALGGNANTAIICNITLAQIHADETKSSLQFATRALRVTNCARVNEILTDAALLKRQKKEIEELKAKLQGSHSEHFEEEILNLRNTLLQTELERERIALELEEEKKAQAEREKRLQEQAKKIENLSSMVLYSSRDENLRQPKKDKRRDTWCFGNLPRENIGELNSTVDSKASAVKPSRPERDLGPLLPFEELVNEANPNNSGKPEEGHNGNAVEDCTLPNPCALLNVTSRKKVPHQKKSLHVENNELKELQAEYEELLLKFETQRTMSKIQIDYLTRKLTEANLCLDGKSNVCSTNHLSKSTIHGDATKSLKESDAILVIKQLQEKINMSEIEKSSSQENLDFVIELASEQNIGAIEKYEELYEELLGARLEARISYEQIASIKCNFESVNKLSLEVQEIELEVQNLRDLSDGVFLVVDELLQSFSALSNPFTDIKSLACHNSIQLTSIINNHERLRSCILCKIHELENEKLLLQQQSVELQSQIEDLKLHVKDSAKKLSEQHDVERSELLSQIQTLQKEISCLSSSFLAKEKENLRKELDKKKTKLRDTEFKLKNAIQEKTKLEGEKACAERELKKLESQQVLLQRDISKHESLAGKRRDSVVERSSNIFDPKKAKGLSVSFEQMLQEEYKKLEVLAFEMETTIASLEDELTAANEEKQMAISRNESLVSEMQVLSDKLDKSCSELNILQEEVSDLSLHLEETKSLNQKLEGSITVLVEEKEELAMQLAEALLAAEEEKVIWSAKEKASLEAIEEQAKSHNSEIMLLSKEMSELLTAKAEVEELTNRLSRLELKIHHDHVKNGKERAKLRMRLKGTQAKSEAFYVRYMGTIEELDVMNKKYEEASAKLKSQLASYALEVLDLKKQLSELRSH